MGIDKFDSPAEIKQFLVGRCISELMLLVWHTRKDLQAAFDLNSKAGQESYINWYDITVNRVQNNHSSHAKQTVTFYSRLKKIESRLSRASLWISPIFRNRAKKYWYWLMAKAARITSSSVLRRAKVLPLSPDVASNLEPALVEAKPGASLVGYAHAELGMGEHVRMSAAALFANHVPFGVVNFGAGTTSRQKAELEQGQLIDSNEFKANIFHVNADQLLPALVHLGRGFFEQRYNICYPFWELSRFPDEWLQPLQLMDEVWAPTTFIQGALERALGMAIPLMPVSVALPSIVKFGRRTFQIPEDQYQFFFAFDCYSYIDRKNPYAIVAAFKAAFPLESEKAGLIIKVMNANESSEGWKKLLNLIGGDKRIRIISETMAKPKLLSLVSECDCYISLHRAEGLGLGPMEAMLLGKPVIITNYSGSTDYAKADHACLVDYSLIPVEHGQYVFYENQVWADPDIQHAAWYMKKLVNEPEFGILLGQKAAEFLAKNFSPAHCGQQYMQRLQQLGMLD